MGRNGTVQSFQEGGMNQATKIRYAKIAQQLSNSYLEKQILYCRDQSSNLDFSHLTQAQRYLFDKLVVQSITSEVGRALVGLTILQLCVKSIEPEQMRNGLKNSFTVH